MTNESTPRVIFHLDLDAFFASIHEIYQPELKQIPFVVGDRSEKTVVSCANYLARERGICAAMPIFKARQILPNLTICECNHNLYQYYSKKFFCLLAQYFSCPIEKLSIDECYLDVSTLLTKYHGNCLELAQKIKDKVHQKLNLNVSIGISYNKTLAKMASDLAKPNGIKEIRPEDLQTIIWPMSVGKLPFIGHKTMNYLCTKEIKTIEDLAQCQIETIEPFFHKSSYKIIQIANGIDHDPIKDTSEQSSISVSHNFLSNINDSTQILLVIKNLSEKLSVELKLQSMKAKTIRLGFKKTSLAKIRQNQWTARYFFDDQSTIYHISKNIYEKYFSSEQMRMISLAVTNFYDTDQLLLDQADHPEDSFQKIADDVNQHLGKKILKILKNFDDK